VLTRPKQLQQTPRKRKVSSWAFSFLIGTSRTGSMERLKHCEVRARLVTFGCSRHVQAERCQAERCQAERCQAPLVEKPSIPQEKLDSATRCLKRCLAPRGPTPQRAHRNDLVEWRPNRQEPSREKSCAHSAQVISDKPETTYTETRQLVAQDAEQLYAGAWRRGRSVW